MTDVEVQAARNLAYAMQLVMHGIGLAPSLAAATTSIPGTVIALCDEVARLRAEAVTIRDERDEWKARYHGSVDRARIAEQELEKREEQLVCHRGPCPQREPSDNPNKIGARCVRFLGHSSPCRWSRP